jgi:hypothetical protein
VRGRLHPLLHRHLCMHASSRCYRSRPWCTTTSIRDDSRSYYQNPELVLVYTSCEPGHDSGLARVFVDIPAPSLCVWKSRTGFPAWVLCTVQYSYSNKRKHRIKGVAGCRATVQTGGNSMDSECPERINLTQTTSFAWLDNYNCASSEFAMIAWGR